MNEPTLVSETEFDLLHALVAADDSTLAELSSWEHAPDLAWARVDAATFATALESLVRRGWVVETKSIFSPTAAGREALASGALRATAGPPWKSSDFRAASRDAATERWLQDHPEQRRASEYWSLRAALEDRRRHGGPGIARKTGGTYFVPEIALELLLDMVDEDSRRLYEVFPYVRRWLGIEGLHREVVEHSVTWLRELHALDLVDVCLDATYPDTVPATWPAVDAWFAEHGLDAAARRNLAPGPELVATELCADELERDTIKVEEIR